MSDIHSTKKHCLTKGSTKKHRLTIGSTKKHRLTLRFTEETLHGTTAHCKAVSDNMIDSKACNDLGREALVVVRAGRGN